MKNYRTARQRSRLRAARDRARGYSINGKMLGLAYTIELVIIGAAVAAGVQFANRYADPSEAPQQIAALGSLSLPLPSHSEAWWMAIIATVAIAIAELARVPLAQAVRSHPQWIMRGFAIVGVLMMCVVTTKSMSQVMEQMFHPRLRHVQEATIDVHEAEADLVTVRTSRDAIQAKLDPQQADVDEANKHIDDINKNIEAQGAAPAPREEKRAVPGWCTNKRGKKYRCTRTVSHWVTDPWKGDVFVEQLPDAIADRDAKVAKRDAVAAEVAAADLAVAAREETVTASHDARLTAVADSQLHSFTAMMFGKDPVEVTDAEVHWFLRLFVFVPAVMIALASTLLAFAAYTRVKPVPASANIRVGSIITEDGTLTRHIESVAKSTIANQNQHRAA